MPAANAVLFQWDNTYSVNIGVIDMQHKTLVATVNALHQAMIERSGKAKLGGILSTLIKYTQAHFATEEKLMQSHGYPDFLPHKSEHENLTRTALDLQSRFLSNQVGLSVEVMDFLKDWLVKHILGSDKKYTPFLNAKRGAIDNRASGGPLAALALARGPRALSDPIHFRSAAEVRFGRNQAGDSGAALNPSAGWAGAGLTAQIKPCLALKSSEA